MKQCPTNGLKRFLLLHEIIENYRIVLTKVDKFSNTSKNVYFF